MLRRAVVQESEPMPRQPFHQRIDLVKTDHVTRHCHRPQPYPFPTRSPPPVSHPSRSTDASPNPGRSPARNKSMAGPRNWGANHSAPCSMVPFKSWRSVSDCGGRCDLPDPQRAIEVAHQGDRVIVVLPHLGAHDHDRGGRTRHPDHAQAPTVLPCGRQGDQRDHHQGAGRDRNSHAEPGERSPLPAKSPPRCRSRRPDKTWSCPR